MPSIGLSYAKAIADKDEAALRALLADDVDFKGLTPRRCWETHSATELLEVLFMHWFEQSDQIRELVFATTGRIGPRESMTYRLRVDNESGRHDVEQHGYFETRADRISYLRIICSGFLLIEDEKASA